MFSYGNFNCRLKVKWLSKRLDNSFFEFLKYLKKILESAD